MSRELRQQKRYYKDFLNCSDGYFLVSKMSEYFSPKEPLFTAYSDNNGVVYGIFVKMQNASCKFYCQPSEVGKIVFGDDCVYLFPRLEKPDLLTTLMIMNYLK
uniref:Uncharacterized protein n=1 Tax=Dulem virus 135 TaxID=3145612 RepID=A0AAU8B4L1_9VIRU